MSFNTLNVATRGFLAATTLAVATSGFLQYGEVVEVPVTPFAPSQQRYVEPRKPTIVHALNFRYDAYTELAFKATSRLEFESKTPTEVEYNSLSLFRYNASADITGKNVRVTDITSNANLVLDVKSEVYTYSAASAEVTYNSTGVLAFDLQSNVGIQTQTNSVSSIESKSTMTFAMSSKVEVFKNTPAVDNEIEEVLAVAVSYLYG